MTEQRKPYWELLRDPRWQEKRLRIMERDGFKCKRCGSSNKTLNVHHHFYGRGLKPWEYDESQLSTLCEDCHERFESLSCEIRDGLNRLTTGEIERIRDILNVVLVEKFALDSIGLFLFSIFPEFTSEFYDDLANRHADLIRDVILEMARRLETSAFLRAGLRVTETGAAAIPDEPAAQRTFPG